MKPLIFSFIFLSLIGMGILMLNNQNEEKFVKIAIVTPVTHPSLENNAKGFIDTLPKSYRFKIYNAQGNPNLLRSEIEDAVAKDYDLVFTIGSQASLMSKEVFAKKSPHTPLVFTVVPYPSDLNLKSEGQLTGVSESLAFEQQLNLLLQLKKDLKRILLVYNPTHHGLEKDRQEVEAILKARGISLTAVEIFKTNEMKQKIQPFISQADALLVLKDNTVITGLDILTRLCQQHRVILLTSDLDSPDHGAGLGYGVSEYAYGVEAAKKAQLILEEGLSPAQIPITSVTDFQLKINFAALAEQGLTLDPQDPDLPPHIVAEAL